MVDVGRMKEKSFDPLKRMESLVSQKSFLMGQTWPLFCLFSSFSQLNDNYSTELLTMNGKRVDGI